MASGATYPQFDYSFDESYEMAHLDDPTLDRVELEGLVCIENNFGCCFFLLLGCTKNYKTLPREFTSTRHWAVTRIRYKNNVASY